MTGERHWGRRAAAATLVVVAVLLCTGATVGVWAKRTVFHPSRVVEAVESVASDQEVVDALAARIADQIMVIVDGVGIVEAVLPDGLDPLAPVIRHAFQQTVQDQVAQVLDSDAGRKLMLGAVRVASAQAIGLVRGDGLPDDSMFSVTDGQVTIEVSDLILRTMDLLQRAGIVPDTFDLATVYHEVTHDLRVRALERVFGVRLPREFGQIVVLDTAAVNKTQGILDASQRMLKILDATTTALVIGAAIAVPMAFVVSVNRRRTLAQMGVLVALCGIAVRFGVHRIVAESSALMNTTVANAAVHDITDALTDSLKRTSVLMALIGVGLTVLAMLLRPRRESTGPAAS